MLRTNNRHKNGFTIVEIIVVIAVIGILATLSYVAFGNWREHVAKTEVKSDLNGAVSAMESTRNFSDGYPLSIPSSFTASDNVELNYVSGDKTNFCIDGKSTVRPTVIYFVKSSVSKEPKYGSCALGEIAEGSYDPNPTEGKMVTTLAGSGTRGFADGAGTNAQFNDPYGVAVDSAGTVYVADNWNNRIRKITPAGVVTTLAGSGTGGFADGTGTNAKFSNPQGVAVDSTGTVYVADGGNQRIRKITSAGVVTTLAGGTQGDADGTGTNAQFFNPAAVTVDSSGTVYVADYSNFRIRKITPAGVVTTLAGGTQGYADGTGTNARFDRPNDVAVDNSGTVYVADRVNNRIRKITPAGVVTTLAGSGTGGFADGTGTNAKFYRPESVAVDNSGTVYVTDTFNQRIRKISPAGVVTTLAGSGTGGFADGTDTDAQFYYPVGVAIDSAGTVYVGDTSNYRIRMIQ